MYCPGHAGTKGSDREDRLVGKVTITNGLHLWGSEVLRSLRHNLRAQIQGHHPSIAWRGEVWKEEALDSFRWRDEKGPSSIRRTPEPFQRQRWSNFWETGWSAYRLFPAHIYHFELNWWIRVVKRIKISWLRKVSGGESSLREPALIFLPDFNKLKLLGKEFANALTKQKQINRSIYNTFWRDVVKTIRESIQ